MVTGRYGTRREDVDRYRRKSIREKERTEKERQNQQIRNKGVFGRRSDRAKQLTDDVELVLCKVKTNTDSSTRSESISVSLQIASAQRTASVYFI